MPLLLRTVARIRLLELSLHLLAGQSAPELLEDAAELLADAAALEPPGRWG